MAEADELNTAYASTDELLDLGVLQEANRRFFHLLGLELVARVEADGTHSLHVVDGRTTEGGMTFGHREPEWLAIRRERVRTVERLLASRVRVRRRLHGFGRQPVEEL